MAACLAVRWRATVVRLRTLELEGVSRKSLSMGAEERSVGMAQALSVGECPTVWDLFAASFTRRWTP